MKLYAREIEEANLYGKIAQEVIREHTVKVPISDTEAALLSFAGQFKNERGRR
jgi:hypothetical protein